MNENLDILPAGAAEDYGEYLTKIKETMEWMLEETGHLAEVLDGHDQNSFTEPMQDFLKTLAGTAEGTARSAQEITSELLRSLEEKNAIVNSRTQEEYISEIREKAAALEDLEPYRDCELMAKNGKSFSDEEKNDLQARFVDLTESWEEGIRELKQEAEGLNETNEQNELSGVYLELSQVLEKLLQNMTENIENAGSHLNTLEESYRDRKQKMTSQAREGFDSAAMELRQKIADAAERFSGLDF